MRFCISLLILFCALSTAHTQERSTPLVPLEDFFRTAEFTEWRISPDGETLLAVGPWENRRNLFSFDLRTMQPRRLTGFREGNVSSAMWATNDRILYFMDTDGDESFGIFAINKDGGRPRTLVRPLNARQGAYIVRYTQVIDRLHDDDSGVLVINNDNHVDYPDVFFMNINNGNKRIVVRNPGNVVRWITDQNSVVRIGLYSDRDSKKSGVLYRRDANSPWEDLGSFGNDAPSWTPIAFDFDEYKIYVASNLQEDRTAIFEFDLKERTFGRQLFSHPLVDVDGLIMSREFRAPVGVVYNAQKPGVVWFAEERQQIQQLLDRSFPDTINRIVSLSEDETRMVIASSSDRHPVFFHLLDFRGGSLRLLPLSKSMPWINPEHMATMMPIEVTARDGKILHGYLTLPRDRKDGERVPMIVNPHGGPWARDSWGFNREVQFLANRGFAVLQINFRSSTGFGREFLLAGNRRWATDMQYDIKDAVLWTIENGYADPERIGLYGASYGGYATMMQLVRFPELYRLGINYVGVVDLVDLINHRRRIQQMEVYAYYQRTIGDPETEAHFLRQSSPIHLLDNLRAPVFIIHGTRDQRVPINQATMLRNALRQRNHPFEWMVKANEGHGFRREENNFEKYAAIERFLQPLLK